jgi:hypothetical protein
MQQSMRMGELLRQMVPLSDLDVEEILTEQDNTRRRFGSIALSWGLCQPEHVWSAWLSQLETGPQRFSLKEAGIDAQAVEHLPQALAAEYGAMPVRVVGEHLIIATDEANLPRAQEELPARLQRSLRFIVCEREEIETAHRKYYAAFT